MFRNEFDSGFDKMCNKFDSSCDQMINQLKSINNKCDKLDDRCEKFVQKIDDVFDKIIIDMKEGSENEINENVVHNDDKVFKGESNVIVHSEVKHRKSRRKRCNVNKCG